ncbi:UTRA domain-containing protein [Virgibacillus dakarensis]|uniref:GntR family transcriptional regulator n=1 Tax=Lentibacillus populi TaxID=1827502 RepID=A0A9W5TXY0_9BACI|nr:GntR family transcriptional regulator [Lentibacillus populi]MBT2217537.1 GntR family transcriptional regulator [Virgibacillus dakarensis]MTW87899.1 UTRA domain-containing protein [Virgibacillus dakarensis]GGB45918.1 GntR family transcriptional regulator [Lentibacillus populi]
MSLNFESPEPLHIQLKKKLKEDILNGCYKNKIPSERTLMERYSVSRTTVRMSVSMLVNEGILQKSHGKGTFISNTPVQDWLGSFKSFTETVKSTGMNPGSKLIYQGKSSSPEKVGNILGLDQFYLIERLRFADDIPVAIEKHYYSVEIGEKLEKYDLNTVVIYDLLETTLGINLWKAKQSITSGKPLKQDAKYLEILESSSVLLSERIIYDPQGNPIEFLNSVFRPDMYSFNIEMMRAREN